MRIAGLSSIPVNDSSAFDVKRTPLLMAIRQAQRSQVDTPALAQFVQSTLAARIARTDFVRNLLDITGTTMQDGFRGINNIRDDRTQ